jgi:hypothetical protein
MSAVIQLRGDTAANWSSVNPILAAREIGINTDTLAYKIGNGTTPWSALPYRELSGVFGGALQLQATANPSVPPAGSMMLYAHDVAGRMRPKSMGPSGLDDTLQSALYGNAMVFLTPSSGTAFSIVGHAAPTAVGTVSHPAIVASGNLRSATRRGIVTSAATANSISELRIAAHLGYRGEVFGTAVAGGFFFVSRFGVSSSTALQRAASGLFNTTAAIAATQQPSALTNCIFAGWDSGETTLKLMHNDAAGSCTKIDLGASFPTTDPNAIYELVLFCRPNGDEFGYRVTRLDTGAQVSGTITSLDVPSKSTLLTWHSFVNNGGTAAAVVLDQYRMYFESDY